MTAPRWMGSIAAGASYVDRHDCVWEVSVRCVKVKRTEESEVMRDDLRCEVSGVYEVLCEEGGMVCKFRWAEWGMHD
jgi:hypothetical protein